MHTSATDPVRRFWLERCEGFLVESPGGRIGVVREVLPSLETIAVPGGLCGTRLSLIPFGEVREVWPLERRLVRSTPAHAAEAPCDRPAEPVGAAAR